MIYIHAHKIVHDLDTKHPAVTKMTSQNINK